MLEGFEVKVLDADGKREAESFVMSTWLKSFEKTGMSLSRPKLQRDVYYRAYHPEATRLFRASRVALAFASSDPDTYAGWACGSDGGVLHYVFVRGGCRLVGIGHELAQAVCGGEPRIYTFTPRKTDLLDVAARKGMKYHPHPIPGVAVARQLSEQRGTTPHGNHP